MSDCDQTTISNVEAEAGLENETPATATTTGTSRAALQAFTNTTTPTTTAAPPSLSIGISLPIPPSSPPNQHARMPSEILPRLFISDIFTAVNAPTLRSFRITHIISVLEYAVAFPALRQPRAAAESHVFSASPGLVSHPPLPEPISFSTLHIPLTDSPAAHIFSFFPTTRDFIATALKDEHARVLVHCYKGLSRSPTIVTAYLMSTLKLSTRDALKMIETKRPGVLPNRGFLKQLEHWEVIVREEEKIVCSEK